jgi:hypothetical protein
MFYEGNQWRPAYNHWGYNGVPQYNGPQYYYNARPPRPMDEVCLGFMWENGMMLLSRT